MDPLHNPYAPGAGAPPPELAGRDALREHVGIALKRLKLGRQSKSVILIGLRGVGKTVLLDRMRLDAEADGAYTLRIEAPEHRSLPAMLAPQLRTVLLNMSRVEQAKDLAHRALRGLAGFAKALKVKYQDLEVGLDLEPEPGLADNGDLENDLPKLFEVTGAVAQKLVTCIAIFMDELQYVDEDELAALITALHRAAQLQLPITLVGAGLPQLRGKTGKAKSYAERLFTFEEIGPLDRVDAMNALVKPANAEGVGFEIRALDRILEQTQGYPYFLQEWGRKSWEVARESPITAQDVDAASQLALAELDASFFGVRFDRLTPIEKTYLRAMADLGAGPHRSGDIAARLSRSVSSLAPTRNKLILKGMIWSPHHGDTAFTVPLFDGFMKRIMPGAPSTW